ncbi:MAG: NAD(P)/FAD-dependent oxidoreductase [Sandaracinaceae bacterium]
MRQIDVAIVGGGLAGNLLARQLRLEAPELSVALFERSRERAYKVGESTVEIAANYLTRRLRLSTYLYKEHLPKFGLRYFFDRPDLGAPLPGMSEVGSFSAPIYPSFQLDRARFEADLLAWNEADGVEVHVGSRVKEVTLGAPHTFVAVDDGAAVPFQARWLIDCTGREGLLAKQLGLRVPEPSHRVAAAWGRFAGVTDIDGLDEPAFHARAHHSSRVLSTIHFMYDGYWAWLIPLRQGLTSVGLVAEASRWAPSRHTVDGLLAELRRHRALRELLEDVEAVALAAFTQLAFRTERFFSPDRWAVIGDAAAFVDPFYSPGSDFIALENDLVADLVCRDVTGEAIEERALAYDRYVQYRFDTAMAVYDGLYGAFGSYGLFRAKVYFDTAVYYALLFDSYARDEHRDLRWVRSELRRRTYGLALMAEVKDLFVRAAAELRRTGRYHADNLGEHDLDAFRVFGILTDIGAPRSRRERNERTEALFRETQLRVAAALGDGSDLGRALRDRPRPLFDAWSQLAAP